MSNSNNNTIKKTKNTSKKNAKNSTQKNTSKPKSKRSEAAIARRAQKWATQRAQKKAESVAHQQEKKLEEERKTKSVLELFPNVLSLVAAQGFMPNIKHSTLLSKTLTQKLTNAPLFQNADRSTIYPNGMTLLNKYLEDENWAEAMKVLDKGVPKQVLEHPLRFGRGTPLMYAYDMDEYDIFERLLNKGADPNTTVGIQSPFIDLIISDPAYDRPQEKRLRYIRALVAHGVKLETPDRTGYTPLDVALALKEDAIANYLIDTGVDLEKPTAKGFTSVLTAISNGRLEVFKYMLETRTLDLNKQTGPNKLSPLKMATVHANLDMLKEVLKHDIDLNQQDAQGNTALHYAVMTKNYEKLKLLLQKGADPTIQNKKRITPEDLAKKIFHPMNPRAVETLSLLKNSKPK